MLYSIIIEESSANGYYDILSISDDDNIALRLAIDNRHYNIVEVNESCSSLVRAAKALIVG